MNRKLKKYQWYPENAHTGWYDLGIITEELLDGIKTKLGKIGISKFKPHPKDIFKNFGIDPESVKMILVNNIYPLNVSVDTKYEEYPQVLKLIWDKLQKHEGWEKVEQHTQPDLSDFLSCLKLSTQLTTNSDVVWDEFMINLFSYYGDCVNDRYLFIFCDEPSFNKYSKYVAKQHEVHYGFEPEAIQEYFMNQWGENYLFGLPF